MASFPTLLLQDVRILDAQHRPALQLPKVVLTISPAPSCAAA